MNAFGLLVAIAVALGSAWTLLGIWLIGERSLYDRARTQTERDTQALRTRAVESWMLSGRRLRRIALGPQGDAAAVAASELVRRDGPRLRATAATGRHGTRLRALAVLARGRDADASELIRSAIDARGAASTTGLLRLVGELPIEEGDPLLLEVLVAGRLPRSRTATELEPRTARLRRKLITLTRSDDPDLRYWAVTLLKTEVDRVSALKAVRARVTDASPSVRAAVAEALGFAPSGSATDLLAALLADETFYVRSHAARAVAQGGEEDLADDLLPLLADRNWWVRAAAKESLAGLGNAGLRVAVAALSHPDPFARDGAIEIIAASGRQVDDLDFIRLAASVLRTRELAVA